MPLYFVRIYILLIQKNHPSDYTIWMTYASNSFMNGYTITDNYNEVFYICRKWSALHCPAAVYAITEQRPGGTWQVRQ